MDRDDAATDTDLSSALTPSSAHQAAGTLTIGQHIELKYRH